MNNEQMKGLWQEACGDAPASLTQRIYSAVLKQSREQTRPYKPSLALALGLILLMGSAFALERMGLLDTLNQVLRGNLLPNASELVNHDIPYEVNQAKLAKFALEEALFDGHQVYLTLRVMPTDPQKTLLMDDNALPAWSADYRETGEPMKGESFAEKAQAAGQALVQSTLEKVSVSGKEIDAQPSGVRYLEDDLLYTLSFPAEGDEARIKLYLLAGENGKGLSETDHGSLAFDIGKSPQNKQFLASTPLPLPLSGLNLTKVQLELTPIAAYLSVQYALREDATPLQAVSLSDGIWVNWLDASGRPRENGEAVNSLERLPNGDTLLEQSFGAILDVPEAITLSFYNGLTKERFDQVTLTLMPKEEK